MRYAGSPVPTSSPAFSFNCGVMGYSRHFFIEAKAYVLSALRFIERSRGVSRAVHLGKVSVV